MRPEDISSRIYTYRDQQPYTLDGHSPLRLFESKTAFMIRKLVQPCEWSTRLRNMRLFPPPSDFGSFRLLSTSRANPVPFIENPDTANLSRLPAFVLLVKHTPADSLYDICLRSMPHYNTRAHISRTRARPISN